MRLKTPYVPCLFIILNILFLLSVESSLCKDNYEITIEIFGKVTRASSKMSISGARIIVLKSYDINYVAETRSDSNGFYSLNVTLSRDYIYMGRRYPAYYSIIIVAIYDNSSTPGIDYVPQLRELLLSELSSGRIKVDFSLYPGASIICHDKLFHLKYDEPADRVSFMIVNEEEIKIKLNNSIVEYGENVYSAIRQVIDFLKIPKNLIIVPANKPFNVIVFGRFIEAKTIPVIIVWWRTVQFERAIYAFEKVPLFEKPITLKQGELINVSLLYASVKYSLRCVKSLSYEVNKEISIVEREGFYTLAIKSQYSHIQDLIFKANDYLNENLFSISYAYVKEAYELLRDMKSYLNWLRKEASYSYNFLNIFFSFSSIILSFVFAENLFLRISLAPLFTFILMYLLFLLFPGIKSITSIYFSVLLTLFLSVILSLIEKSCRQFETFSFIYNFIDLISMSKRNLRRRKLRSILLAISLIASTAGAVALTSFSIEIGILANEYNNNFNVTGLSFERYYPLNFLTSAYSNFEAESNSPYGMKPNLILLDLANITGKIMFITCRAESKAKVKRLGFLTLPKNTNLKLNISGIIAFSSSLDPLYKKLETCLIKGNLPSNSNEIVISLRAAEELGVDVGDEIIFEKTIHTIIVRGNWTSFLTPTKSYIVSGILDDSKVEVLREISGRPFLPFTLYLDFKGGDGMPSIYASRVCEAKEVIIVPWNDVSRYDLSVTRYFIYLNCSKNELISIGKILSLRGDEHIATVLLKNKLINMMLARHLISSGYEALIPLVLAILNAIITSIGMLYERRREIITLSAVGASPSKIFSIFAWETAILGFIGGSIGYILGLSFYKLMNLYFQIEVKPKIHFIWVLATILIAIMSMFVASLISLKSSLVIVPSKLWKIEAIKKAYEGEEYWIFEIPIKLKAINFQSFTRYLYEELMKYPSTLYEVLEVKQAKFEKIDGKIVWKLIFTYDTGLNSFSRNFGRGFLEVSVKDDICNILLKVKSYGLNAEEHANKMAKIIRMIALKWK